MKMNEMLEIWSTAVLLLLTLGHFPISCYRVMNEPLRQGCVWSTSKKVMSIEVSTNHNPLSIPSSSINEMALDCNVRTLNSEFWNYTFSTEQRLQTSSLQVKCNDKLYFESHLKLNQSLTQLTHLKSVMFESCKIRKIPTGFWNGFQNLRSLTIQTQNNDWNPSVGLEIESNSFQGLKHLTLLDLSQSNVWTLPDHFLCPHLTNLKHLNLSWNQIIELPDEFMMSSVDDISACVLSVVNLDMTHNTIRRVGRGAFSRLEALTQLRLQQNYIEELEDTAFSGLNQLKLLNSSSNRLVALPPSIFRSNQQLRELYLQNNSLTALSPAVFASLGQLVMLDLSMNTLSSLWIKENVFSGLPQLIVLKISTNQLSYIDSNLFRPLTNLQAIHLDSNKIETIHPEAFSSLTNLQLLDISRNRLSTIDSRLFWNGFSLKSLYLDHNKIGQFGDTALVNCTNLVDLGLAGNNLAEVPKALRTGLKYLRTLDIGENRIVSVSNESFEGLEEVYGLRLVDNRLTELPQGFCTSLKRLRVLNLAQNRINKIPSDAFHGCSDLRALRLDTNILEQLPTSLASELPSLLWLNVSENRIRRVDYQYLPRSIEWLDLSYNFLESLGSGTEEDRLFRNPMSPFHLRVLDASHNRLSTLDMGTIPPSLETLRLNQNQIKYVAPETFSRSSHIRRIELIGNQLETLPLSAITFPPVGPSRPLPEIYLASNPWECSCVMEWFTRVNQLQLTILRQHPRLMDGEGIKCKLTASEVPSTEEIGSVENEVMMIPLGDVKPSQFVCRYKSHCFPGCQCCDFYCDCANICPGNCSCLHDITWSTNIVKCSNLYYEEIPERLPMEASEILLDGNNFTSLGSHIFIGKKNLRLLALNGSQIEVIRNKTFNGLKSLEILYLQENLLKTLNGWEFADLSNLRELYLQNNQISTISSATFSFLPFLQVLQIHGNLLVDFNIWELSGNGYLSRVMLASNPWSCDCEFILPFRSWVASRTTIVLDYTLAKCQPLTLDESEVDTESPLTPVGPTLSSISCSHLQDVFPLDPGQKGVGLDENVVVPQKTSSVEKPETREVDDGMKKLSGSEGSSINFLPMDNSTMDTSVLWAIVLTVAAVLLLLTVLIVIFRKELRTVLCQSVQKESIQGQGHKNHRLGSFPCCLSLGSGKKFFASGSTHSPGQDENDGAKLFDVYFIYNSQDEDLLTQKLIPELQEGKSTNRNQWRFCLHRDLCLGLENPWNLEMVGSAAESSKCIVLLLSKTFLQNEWTHNSDFRLALQSTLLSRHQKKLIFILLPPLTHSNLPTLLTIFPELKAPDASNGLQSSHEILEWTDPNFRNKLKRIFPLPSGSETTRHPQSHHQTSTGQNWSPMTNSFISCHPNSVQEVPDWPYTHAIHPIHNQLLFQKQPLFQPQSHHQYHHHHFHSNHLVHPIGSSIQPFYDLRSDNTNTNGMMLPISIHQPIMFTGPLLPSHSHEHQNSVSTISNTYPPLTDQNLSDSTNTLGSLGSAEDHVYSTLDTPTQSLHTTPIKVNSGQQGTKSQRNSPSKDSDQMYFV